MNDLEDLRSEFEIDSSAAVCSLEVLSDETHSQGKVAMCIIFENGQKIVYKPRSVLAEYHICARSGLFDQCRVDGLPSPVYQIRDYKEYGYVQYLNNDLRENILSEGKHKFMRCNCVG